MNIDNIIIVIDQNQQKATWVNSTSDGFTLFVHLSIQNYTVAEQLIMLDWNKKNESRYFLKKPDRIQNLEIYDCFKSIIKHFKINILVPHVKSCYAK